MISVPELIVKPFETHTTFEALLLLVFEIQERDFNRIKTFP